MSTIFMPKHIHPSYCPVNYHPCALFDSMTVSELDKLDSCSTQTKCAAGNYLFKQNDANDHVYNVITGTVSIERLSSDGRRQIMGFLFPGDFIGITNSRYYEYAVRSITKAEFYRFNRKQLNSLMEDLPHLKSNLSEIKSKIFFRTLDQLYILGQKKAHERLCFLFMQLLERLPGASTDRIELYMSRQDMADYLGLTIETVSRSLSKLKSSGLIAFPTINHLKILDIARVSHLASI